MKNKYGAHCAKCRQWVGPGEGDTNKVNERWVTVHNTCPLNRGYFNQPHSTRSYEDPMLSGLTGREYDDEFYSLYGMTQADFKDAVNPDEGDHG